FTDEALPSDVYTALNGTAFNAAMSDIRPEDALFATTRALTALGTVVTGTAFKGLGYGPGPIGSLINSEFSTKYAQVVNFAMTGTDPITSEAVPSFLVQNVGRFTLGRVQAGLTTRTRDLIPSSGLPIVPLNVLLREPLSGTWNTMEYCIPNSKEVALTQE